MLCFELVLLSVLCRGWASTLQDADKLLHDLFTTYNTELRPVQDQDRPVNVSIGLALISISDFNEVAGVISTAAALLVNWIDETLVWDPNNYGNLTYITISQNKIWHPNLFSADPSTKAFDIGHDKFVVKVTSAGEVTWSPGWLIRGPCLPDVSKFPFDRQTCKLEIFTAVYTRNEVTFTMMSSTVLLSYFRPNSEYSLTGSSANVKPSLSDIAEFHLMIERRPLNFLISVIFPIIMLGLVNPLVFILPFSSGERSSYSITVLLAFTVYMTVVSDKMPESSEPMSYLSYYILELLAISTLIVIANVFQIRIREREEEQEPVPHWICNLSLFLKKAYKRGQVNVMEDSNKLKNNSKGTSMNLESLDSTEHPSTTKPMHADAINDIVSDVHLAESVSWNNIAKCLDKMYFIIFQLLIIVSTTVLFTLTAT